MKDSKRGHSIRVKVKGNTVDTHGKVGQTSQSTKLSSKDCYKMSVKMLLLLVTGIEVGGIDIYALLLISCL